MIYLRLWHGNLGAGLRTQLRELLATLAEQVAVVHLGNGNFLLEDALQFEQEILQLCGVTIGYKHE